MAALFSGRDRSETRAPAVPGMFYPGSPSSLNAQPQQGPLSMKRNV